nr:MAG TPA: hypothetical protein [Caudoviricetes sp.]
MNSYIISSTKFQKYNVIQRPHAFGSMRPFFLNIFFFLHCDKYK